MTAIWQTTFLHIFYNENVAIAIKILLKFVPNGPKDNDPALESDNGLAPMLLQAIIKILTCWNVLILGTDICSGNIRVD